MFVSKYASLFAVVVFAAVVSGTELFADGPHPVGLRLPPHPVMGVTVVGRPAPHPVLGLPMPPRPPVVVGLPGPRPIGLPLPPRPIGKIVVGMPFPPHPIGIIVPPVGLPIPPRAQYELNCTAIRGNVSGIDRLSLTLDQINFGDYQVTGYLRYANGASANVNTIGRGTVSRGVVDLSLENVGTIAVRPTRVGLLRRDIRGEVYLYGALDQYGLSCDIDRD